MEFFYEGDDYDDYDDDDVCGGWNLDQGISQEDLGRVIQMITARRKNFPYARAKELANLAYTYDTLMAKGDAAGARAKLTSYLAPFSELQQVRLRKLFHAIRRRIHTNNSKPHPRTEEERRDWQRSLMGYLGNANTPWIGSSEYTGTQSQTMNRYKPLYHRGIPKAPLVDYNRVFGFNNDVPSLAPPAAPVPVPVPVPASVPLASQDDEDEEATLRERSGSRSEVSGFEPEIRRARVEVPTAGPFRGLTSAAAVPTVSARQLDVDDDVLFQGNDDEDDDHDDDLDLPPSIFDEPLPEPIPVPETSGQRGRRSSISETRSSSASPKTRPSGQTIEVVPAEIPVSIPAAQEQVPQIDQEILSAAKINARKQFKIPATPTPLVFKDGIKWEGDENKEWRENLVRRIDNLQKYLRALWYSCGDGTTVQTKMHDAYRKVYQIHKYLKSDVKNAKTYTNAVVRQYVKEAESLRKYGRDQLQKDPYLIAMKQAKGKNPVK